MGVNPFSARRVIGNTLAAMHGPASVGIGDVAYRLAVRRRQLERMDGSFKRGMALLLHDLTVDDPQKYEKLRRKLGGVPAECIGSGVAAAVYVDPCKPRKDQLVKKVYRDLSGDMSSTERLVLFETLHMVGTRLFKGIALEGSVEYGPDPLTEEPEPILRQPYCDFKEHDDDLFPATVDVATLAGHYEQLDRRHPGAVSAVLSFCDHAHRVLGLQGFLPDLEGTNNVVVGTVGSSSSPEMYMIDTTPLDIRHESYEHIHRHIVTKLAAARRACATLG